MRDVITVVLAGIGGYGRMYLSHLLDGPEARACKIVGVADPVPQRCDRLADAIARSIPVHESLEAFYETQHADLAIIATPVHLHSKHILLALSHGSHVLCEKPLASSMNDIAELIESRDSAHRHVAIGYQWSFSPAIRQLKRDVATGVLGKPLRMRTMVLWPRGEEYYARNGWAGRVNDVATGAPVLDSPLHNACAHFVHNMFYILGDARDPKAYPSAVTAELYRANTIENYDTAAVRCTIGGGDGHDGVEAMMFASHAVPRRCGPVFSYEFENATVSYSDAKNSEGVIAHFRDGRVRNYGLPCASNDPTKLWHMVDCIRTGDSPMCGIEAAAAQTALVCAAQESAVQIGTFPDSSVVMQPGESGTLRWVEQLEDQLKSCYESMQLPSEAGLSWGKPGNRVEVDPPEVFLEPVNGKHNGKAHTPNITTSLFVPPRVSVSRRPLTEPR
jgi:predicted dehydrogenase